MPELNRSSGPRTNEQIALGGKAAVKIQKSLGIEKRGKIGNRQRRERKA
jgi:hypothetical protein